MYSLFISAVSKLWSTHRRTSMSSHTSTPTVCEPLIAIQLHGGTERGERVYNEDVMAVELDVSRDHAKAFLGVFDGHAGKEAAVFAGKELWANISSLEEFYSSESEAIKKAISQGFQDTHHQMWHVRQHWKPSSYGTLSEAGTTASVVIIRQNRMFVANVGDSTVVLGCDPNFIDFDSAVSRGTMSTLNNKGQIKAVVLTNDHKPESAKETRRIEQIGGRVLMCPSGVMRVAKYRKRIPAPHSRLRVNSITCDAVPVLNIARSLGDLWSYSEQHHDYFVSPVPDVSEYKLITQRDKFVIIASDGLWNAMSPQKVVEFVHTFRQKELLEYPLVKSSKVARALISKALEGWHNKYMVADNISVLIAFFLPSGREVSS